MAFTGEDLTSINLALKTFFVDETISDIPDRVPFLKTIKGRLNERPTGGRSLTATWHVETGTNLGYDDMTEASDFPAPRESIHQNYSLSPAHLACSFEFSGHAEASGNRKDMTYIMDIAEKFANDTKKTVTRLIGTLLMLDGTANLGTILSIATNTITMDTGNIFNVILQMRLTIRDTATGGSEQLSNGSQPADGLVSNVDEFNNAFTIGNATGAAAGDFIAIYELYGATLPNAIRNIIAATGTFQGINRATAGNTFAVSKVRTDTGAFGDNMLIQTAHDVMRFSRDEDPTAEWLAVTDYDTVRWYALTKLDQVRFAPTDKFVGGYRAVGVATGGGGIVNLAEDPRAWPGEVAFLRPKDFGFLRPTSGLTSGWVENGDGSYLFQKTGSSAGGVYADAKQGFWMERYNIYCDRPRNSARLTGYRSI